MVYLKQAINNNSNKAVNLTIRLRSLDQQEEKTNSNKPFGHSALESLVSSLSEKAIFACRLARLLVHTVYLDAGMTYECHTLGRSDTIDRHSANAYMPKAVKGINSFLRHNEFA
jgi:hypothetical protein